METLLWFPNPNFVVISHTLDQITSTFKPQEKNTSQTAVDVFTHFPSSCFLQIPSSNAALIKRLCFLTDILPSQCHWPPTRHVWFNARHLLAELWRRNLLTYCNLLLGLFEMNYVTGADRTQKLCQITAIKLKGGDQRYEVFIEGKRQKVISVSLHRE